MYQQESTKGCPDLQSTGGYSKSLAQRHVSPVLRANPFPEDTDLICRIPLSTLFYRPEAVNLGDLMRLWVRSGVKQKYSPSDFQGPS